MVIEDTGGIWVQTKDDTPPVNLMGEADNGGPFMEVL